MKYIFLLPLLLLFQPSHSQNTTLLRPERIIFYNVENLYDTINDPATDDDEFLPSSKKHWNTEKYKFKLEHISKVLGAMLDTIRPLVIGLAEVENQKVLEDLVAQPALKKFKLGIIHHDSPDERGVDVAVLYNKEAIEEPFEAFLKVQFPFSPSDRTREIAYLNGYVNDGEMLWIFVNHWPSRRKDNKDSEQKRMAAEKILRDKINDIYAGDPLARVIVMGDFNDNPIDKSLETLSSITNTKIPEQQALENLMKPLYTKGEFSLKYQEKSDVFDQFIVSKNLLNQRNTYHVRGGVAHIYKQSWLLFNHPKNGMVPNRTFSFDRWVKGYSDHLPIYLDIGFK